MIKSKIAVFLIIGRVPCHDEEIPVIQDKDNPVDKWKMPGGKGEPGETWQETGVREAKEELGLDVEIMEEEPYRENMGSHEFIVARAWYVSGELKLGPNIGKIWFGSENAIRGTREQGLVFFKHSKALKFFGI